MEPNKQVPALKLDFSQKKPPFQAAFTIVNNEKNHLKNDDKTKKKRIFGQKNT